MLVIVWHDVGKFLNGLRSGILRLKGIKIDLRKSNIQLCFYVLWPLLAFFSVLHGDEAKIKKSNKNSKWPTQKS